MILFVNYINDKSPPEQLSKYRIQHRLFTTSVLVKQPGGVASLMTTDGPVMFVEALQRLREIKLNYKCPVVYLDNDCVMMNPIDDLFECDFDVAVVYRYRWEEHNGRQDCLGGFLFFSQKNKDVEDRFLASLISKTQEWYDKELEMGREPWFYDQLAINDLVGSPNKERNRIGYDLSMPFESQIKNVGDAKILFLSANEWACPLTINLPEKVRIIHYNHAIWPIKYEKDVDGIPFASGKVQSAQAISQP